MVGTSRYLGMDKTIYVRCIVIKYTFHYYYQINDYYVNFHQEIGHTNTKNKGKEKQHDSGETEDMPDLIIFESDSDNYDNEDYKQVPTTNMNKNELNMQLTTTLESIVNGNDRVSHFIKLSNLLPSQNIIN